MEAAVHPDDIIDEEEDFLISNNKKSKKAQEKGVDILFDFEGEKGKSNDLM